MVLGDERYYADKTFITVLNAKKTRLRVNNQNRAALDGKQRETNASDGKQSASEPIVATKLPASEN